MALRSEKENPKKNLPAVWKHSSIVVCNSYLFVLSIGLPKAIVGMCVSNMHESRRIFEISLSNLRYDFLHKAGVNLYLLLELLTFSGIDFFSSEIFNITGNRDKGREDE